MANTSSGVFGHGMPGQRGGPDPASGHNSSRGPGIVIKQSVSETTEIKHLGKNTEYRFEYDPTLLNPVDRQENRTYLGITKDKLPFVGLDVWNAYEISFLMPNGAPKSGIAKIQYNADSPFLIESKSLKLYLNSFNMTKIGEIGQSGLEIIEKLEHTIAKDLAFALRTSVSVKFFDPVDNNKPTITDEPYCRIEDMINVNDIKGEWQYKETPSLLTTYPKVKGGANLYFSDSLRSCCKVTGQPDHGRVYIYYSSNDKTLDLNNLYKYIVSFRNECHFHEECCEAMFKRLYDILNNNNACELCVACFYTRRGGIDINSLRSTSYQLIDKLFPEYADNNIMSFKLPRQ